MIQLESGQILCKRYRVESFVGAGGQAIGFRGIDLLARSERHKHVFIKQYHDLVPGSPEAAALDPHFERLYVRLAPSAKYFSLPRQTMVENESVIAVFSLVAGRNLAVLMKEGLTDEECCRFSLALADAVRLLHAQGVCHLDLKPENVVVESNERGAFAVLVDFDAAKIDGVGLRAKQFGTLEYMSPEHFTGEVGPAADVWAVGIMVYMLLFKEHPHAVHDDHPAHIMSGAATVPDPRYDRTVVQVVLEALQRDPDRRPVARTFESALRKVGRRGFIARPGTAWAPMRPRVVGVRLEGQGGNFRRVYYETLIVGRNELRGAGLLNLPSDLMLIEVRARCVSLRSMVNDRIVIGGRRQGIEQVFDVQTSETVTIDGQRFRVEVLREEG